MTYIFIAHKKEAFYLFKSFTCRRDKSFIKPLYLHEKFILVLTHNGYENAYLTAKELFTKYPPSKNDKVINFGICGAPTHYSIAECLHVDTLLYHDKKIKLFNSATSTTLECVDKPQSQEKNHLVDMESFGIYEASKAYFDLNKLFFYKIVSDYFEPKSITKELIDTIIQKNTPLLIEKINE